MATTVEEFTPPGRMSELSADARTAWSNEVSDTMGPFVARHPQFVDPTRDETPADRQPVQPQLETVTWPAFPASLTDGSFEQRLQAADSRENQDEYCEWSVTRRDDGKLTSITFTTELPEYYATLASSDQRLLTELYSRFASRDVALPSLLGAGGAYDPLNELNDDSSASIAHLTHRSNNLLAAVALVAGATVQRQGDDGQRVTDSAELVICGDLGDPQRGSDPQIASKVNNAAAAGAEITLSDPPGLYIADEPPTAGMVTPDDADPKKFWTIQRGEPGHVVRARFEVPEEHGYDVGDIELDGGPIRFGSEIAQQVMVKVTVAVQPGQHTPEIQPCVNG